MQYLNLQTGSLSDTKALGEKTDDSLTVYSDDLKYSVECKTLLTPEESEKELQKGNYNNNMSCDIRKGAVILKTYPGGYSDTKEFISNSILSYSTNGIAHLIIPETKKDIEVK
jgi:hypothetical protein